MHKEKTYNPIIFLHSPKTGGSTFRNLLHEVEIQNNLKSIHAGAKGLIPKFSAKYFYRNKINNNEIYDGHFVYSDECVGADVFTLVRDVHQTFFSNLYFFFNEVDRTNSIRTKNLNYIKSKIDLNLDFNENDIIAIDELIKNNFLTSNPFTKLISGIPFEKFFFVKHDYKVKENDFNLALKNLEYFKFIGNANKMEKFIQRFVRTYNFKAERYRSQNISNYDRDFIKKMINKSYNLIGEYNSFDFKLIFKIEKMFL